MIRSDWTASQHKPGMDYPIYVKEEAPIWDLNNDFTPQPFPFSVIIDGIMYSGDSREECFDKHRSQIGNVGSTVDSGSDLSSVSTYIAERAAYRILEESHAKLREERAEACRSAMQSIMDSGWKAIDEAFMCGRSTFDGSNNYYAPLNLSQPVYSSNYNFTTSIRRQLRSTACQKPQHGKCPLGETPSYFGRFATINEPVLYTGSLAEVNNEIMRKYYQGFSYRSPVYVGFYSALTSEAYYEARFL